MTSNKSNIDLFTNLILEVRAFEQSLDDKHEVSLTLTTAGGSAMLVTSASYKDPDLVCFYGLISGQSSMSIMHISQINLALIASPILEDRPKREIGFVINKHPH